LINSLIATQRKEDFIVSTTTLSADLIRLKESFARAGAEIERQARKAEPIRELAREILRKHDESTARFREMLAPRLEIFLAQINRQRQQLSERTQDEVKQLSEQSYSF
jgi:hypothetical protein